VKYLQVPAVYIFIIFGHSNASPSEPLTELVLTRTSYYD
jgi:hypothetical protein